MDKSEGRLTSDELEEKRVWLEARRAALKQKITERRILIDTGQITGQMENDDYGGDDQEDGQVIDELQQRITELEGQLTVLAEAGRAIINELTFTDELSYPSGPERCCICMREVTLDCHCERAQMDRICANLPEAARQMLARLAAADRLCAAAEAEPNNTMIKLRAEAYRKVRGGTDG